MEEDILKYVLTVMFRGTPCSLHEEENNVFHTKMAFADSQR